LLKNRAVADKTLFAYFFSTPTTGSQWASIAQYVAKNNPQIPQLRPMEPDGYLADLLRNWLAAQFRFPSYCAYEKQPTYGIALVVRIESASALCTKALDPIDTDHINIVKPSGVGSFSYMAFKAAYADVTIPDLSKQIDERERRKLTRITLGTLLDEGQRLLVSCANDALACNDNDANAWAARAETVFHNQMDDSYIARFRSSPGFSFTVPTITSPLRQTLWNGINNRNTRLQEFIREYVN
jgi:hypothetical protein